MCGPNCFIEFNLAILILLFCVLLAANNWDEQDVVDDDDDDIIDAREGGIRAVSAIGVVCCFVLELIWFLKCLSLLT